MSKADLSIGAGGSTNWERFCLGLPSIVITTEKNQVPVNMDLQDMGLIELVGDMETVSKNQIKIAIENILVKQDTRLWSKKCMSVCSGDGPCWLLMKCKN